MKRLILLGLVLLGSWGAVELTTPSVQAETICTVKCPPCPDGWVPAPPNGGQCCRCVHA
jgi:hypothetical protein